MRIITHIIAFYFNVQVWRNIISMFTILSVVLIFGTANMDYIFFIHVIVCERRKIRKKREREKVCWGCIIIILFNQSLYWNAFQIFLINLLSFFKCYYCDC